MILLMLIILAGSYTYVCVKRVLSFFWMNASQKGGKLISALLAAAVVALCMITGITAMIVLLHILGAVLIFDVVFTILRSVYRRSEKKSQTLAVFYQKMTLIPVILAMALVGYGFANMGHVVRTQYQLKTDKKIGAYRIALITDTHYGTIQDTELLREKMGELNRENPDIVILGGDIVEENTSKEQMQEVFAIFGEIDSKYGIYYVYGNHDCQPYSSEKTYTKEELVQAIEENGIVILEDSCVEIGGELILAGRGDAGSERAGVSEILQGADRDKYIMVADHQPVQAEENEEQGVDLELSGHTHAGQIWPIGWITRLSGGLNYGEYRQGGCTVIVSSGFAGWGFPIRTAKHCEYVVIELSGSLI